MGIWSRGKARRNPPDFLTALRFPQVIRFVLDERNKSRKYAPEQNRNTSVLTNDTRETDMRDFLQDVTTAAVVIGFMGVALSLSAAFAG